MMVTTMLQVQSVNTFPCVRTKYVQKMVMEAAKLGWTTQIWLKGFWHPHEVVFSEVSSIETNNANKCYVKIFFFYSESDIQGHMTEITSNSCFMLKYEIWLLFWKTGLLFCEKAIKERQQVQCVRHFSLISYSSAVPRNWWLCASGNAACICFIYS